MSSLPELSENDKKILHSIFNPSLPLDMLDIEINDLEYCDETEDNEEIKKLEVCAIGLAENKEFTKSLNIFEQMLSISPERSATYNNRAQVFRLMGNNDAALTDLSNAIKYAKTNSKTSCQAHCQRAILYKRKGENDKAREDFVVAANLGSAFAKQQLIEMNPYAALCNQMLSKAMNQLK